MGDKTEKTARAEALIAAERRKAAKDSMPSFPERSELTRKERVATAALCTLMGYLGMGPSFCPPGVYRIFMLLNNRHYKMIIRWGSLIHVFIVTYLEPPPRLYAISNEEILEMGYSVNNAIYFDGAMCFLFFLHTTLMLAVEYASYGWKIRKFLKVQIVLVMCLSLDMIYNSSREKFGVRPFRFLRPFMYIMLDHQMRLLMAACIETFIPLMKTFLILVLAQIFFAIVGLNMFTGTIAPGEDQNQLGAACWVEAGNIHPFANFQRAFLSVYFLGTADNYPSILWPFYTCDCSFQSVNGTLVEYVDIDGCAMRVYVSGIYFVMYVVVVYLCLGNCVLAVCFFYFETNSKANVMRAFMLQRFSIIAAFHFLENGSGLLYKQDFSTYCDVLSNFMSIDRRQHDILYDVMDDDQSGYITLGEFYPFCDMLQIRMQFYNNKPRFGCYREWKHSQAKKDLLQLIMRSYGPLTYLDWVMMFLVFGNTVLASMESTRKHTQQEYSNVVCFIFVCEAIVKMAALGIRTYFLEFWNRFDFVISFASVAGFMAQRTDEKIKENYSGTFALIGCMRLLRLVGVMNKVLTRRNVKDGKQNYFTKLVDALVTTIPVCMNAILLLIFYMVIFAMVTMEMLSAQNPNSRTATYTTGVIDFKYENDKMYDWADFGSAFQSVFILIVGNTWGVLVENAIAEAEDNRLMWFFMMGHFIGVFLMLNIIQSLFVAAFTALMNEEEYHLTHEYTVADLMKKNIAAFDDRLKSRSRVAKLEYLMATEQDCLDNFNEWCETEGRDRPMALDGIKLNQSIEILDYELREKNRRERQKTTKDEKKLKKGKESKVGKKKKKGVVEVKVAGKLSQKKKNKKKAW